MNYLELFLENLGKETYVGAGVGALAGLGLVGLKKAIQSCEVLCHDQFQQKYGIDKYEEYMDSDGGEERMNNLPFMKNCMKRCQERYQDIKQSKTSKAADIASGAFYGGAIGHFPTQVKRTGFKSDGKYNKKRGLTGAAIGATIGAGIGYIKSKTELNDRLRECNIEETEEKIKKCKELVMKEYKRLRAERPILGGIVGGISGSTRGIEGK